MPAFAQAIEYYTYDDYKHLEGEWELIEGIAYAMAPSPMISHQAIASGICSELFVSTKQCKKCSVVIEQDWKIDEATVLKPDISLICNEPNRSHITKSPLIVVEVISKSTALRDEKYKFGIYKNERVPYCMVVYPDDLKAKIYKLMDNAYIKQGDFSLETYVFSDLECQASIDFAVVFEKFRK
ncbi:MAG TPA: Uma2 family endonuclease [Campylobacterales bacterium]|nr:Uma2 family endonuclease [Campylobacterales bacterium]